MKDAKGHGSDPRGAAHQQGIERATYTLITSPHGFPAQLSVGDQDYPPSIAFTHGRNAYLTGQPENVNPYKKTDVHKSTDPWGQDRPTSLHKEWLRAYRNARRSDRFNATVRDRKAKP